MPRSCSTASSPPTPSITSTTFALASARHTRSSREVASKRDVLAHRTREHERCLRGERHVGAEFRNGAQVDRIERHLARHRSRQARGRESDGRLAGARGANQGGHGARLKVQRDVAQDDREVAVAVVGANVCGIEGHRARTVARHGDRAGLVDLGCRLRNLANSSECDERLRHLAEHPAEAANGHAEQRHEVDRGHEVANGDRTGLRSIRADDHQRHGSERHHEVHERLEPGRRLAHVGVRVAQSPRRLGKSVASRAVRRQAP